MNDCRVICIKTKKYHGFKFLEDNQYYFTKHITNEGNLYFFFSGDDIIDNNYAFSFIEEEFNKYFVTLEDLRDFKLNKIGI